VRSKAIALRVKRLDDYPTSKAALQRQMKETREAMAETVEDIKETVAGQYESVKETVSGVMDFREQFQNEPLVWSLGALSAGFALGYTMGYAHKEMKGKGKHSEVGAFANSLVEELSTVGKSFVMPTLNVRIKELFGFDFSDLLAEIGESKKSQGRKRLVRKTEGKKKTSSRAKKEKAKGNGKGNSKRAKAR
jgi:hypothetical protein